jgi:hypothetical protein
VRHCFLIGYVKHCVSYCCLFHLSDRNERALYVVLHDVRYMHACHPWQHVKCVFLIIILIHFVFFCLLCLLCCDIQSNQSESSSESSGSDSDSEDDYMQGIQPQNCPGTSGVFVVS